MRLNILFLTEMCFLRVAALAFAINNLDVLETPFPFILFFGAASILQSILFFLLFSSTSTTSFASTFVSSTEPFLFFSSE